METEVNLDYKAVLRYNKIIAKCLYLAVLGMVSIA